MLDRMDPNDEIEHLATVRETAGPYGTSETLRRRSGTSVGCLRKLAAADAFGQVVAGIAGGGFKSKQQGGQVVDTQAYGGQLARLVAQPGLQHQRLGVQSFDPHRPPALAHHVELVAV